MDSPFPFSSPSQGINGHEHSPDYTYTHNDGDARSIMTNPTYFQGIDLNINNISFLHTPQQQMRQNNTHAPALQQQSVIKIYI